MLHWSINSINCYNNLVPTVNTTLIAVDGAINAQLIRIDTINNHMDEQLIQVWMPKARTALSSRAILISINFM